MTKQDLGYFHDNFPVPCPIQIFLALITFTLDLKHSETLEMIAWLEAANENEKIQAQSKLSLKIYL